MGRKGRLAGDQSSLWESCLPTIDFSGYIKLEYLFLGENNTYQKMARKGASYSLELNMFIPIPGGPFPGRHQESSIQYTLDEQNVHQNLTLTT